MSIPEEKDKLDQATSQAKQGSAGLTKLALIGQLRSCGRHTVYMPDILANNAMPLSTVVPGAPLNELHSMA